MEFVEEIGPDISVTPPAPPIGGGEVQGILQRYTSEVLFDRMSPADQCMDDGRAPSGLARRAIRHRRASPAVTTARNTGGER